MPNTTQSEEGAKNEPACARQLSLGRPVTSAACTHNCTRNGHYVDVDWGGERDGGHLDGEVEVVDEALGSGGGAGEIRPCQRDGQGTTAGAHAVLVGRPRRRDGHLVHHLPRTPDNHHKLSCSSSCCTIASSLNLFFLLID